jgi:molybdopterin synthase sulfur carrier subunit
MKVKLFANFREICLDKVIEVPSPEESSVAQVLEDLIKLYPAMEEEVFDSERKLKPFVHVFINGKNIIHGDGLNTLVSGQDQFALFPPVAGG